MAEELYNSHDYCLLVDEFEALKDELAEVTAERDEWKQDAERLAAESNYCHEHFQKLCTPNLINVHKQLACTGLVRIEQRNRQHADRDLLCG